MKQGVDRFSRVQCGVSLVVPAVVALVDRVPRWARPVQLSMQHVHGEPRAGRVVDERKDAPSVHTRSHDAPPAWLAPEEAPITPVDLEWCIRIKPRGGIQAWRRVAAWRQAAIAHIEEAQSGGDRATVKLEQPRQLAVEKQRRAEVVLRVQSVANHWKAVVAQQH